MSEIGLARGTVRLEPHNPAWHPLFIAEAERIQAVLEIPLETIQHIGSTAIPGVVAKPIVDIAILVDSLDIAEEWAAPLAGIGYWYKGIQPDMPDRRFFAKGPETKRTVYLHLAREAEFNRLIKFRDYLADDEQAAAEYAALKERLALGNARDRANYSKLKNDFIQRILSKTATPQ